MKNGTNNTKRVDFETSMKTKIFEKKPTKGGTPASESTDSASILVKMLVAPRFENEYSVLALEFTYCIRVVKSKKEVKL